jgi:hypothetical protein
VYIGPEWDPGDDEDFFVCMDTNGPGGRPAYASSSIISSQPPAAQLGVVGVFPEYKALGIRATFGATTSGCIPSATAMCLAGSRFKVEATFVSASASGAAHVVKLTPDTGYLWFFAESNVEAVVKVLDACSLGKFWVFAGGLTNVQVTLTVTDTQTGAVKTYTNPQGTAFKPIQDTGAFSCAP